MSYRQSLGRNFHKIQYYVITLCRNNENVYAKYYVNSELLWDTLKSIKCIITEMPGYTNRREIKILKKISKYETLNGINVFNAVKNTIEPIPNGKWIEWL